jgi:hypothetical protein
MPQYRVLSILALVALAGAVSPAIAADKPAGKSWKFQHDEVGKPPAGFEFTVTGNKKPGSWIVLLDGRNPVLAQVDRDKTERRFAMALVKGSSYKDLRLSVKARPVAGDVEMVAGLVWRYRDADNYYVARFNDDSVRVDRVVKGERHLLTPKEIPVKLEAKKWHTLTVEHRGEAIKVAVGGKTVFEGKDKTFEAPGRIGVWVKADSLTYFDDLKVEELK